jgi:hypothetical protein
VHVCLVSGDGCGWIFCSEVVRVLNYVTSFQQAQMCRYENSSKILSASGGV